MLPLLKSCVSLMYVKRVKNKRLFHKKFVDQVPDGTQETLSMGFICEQLVCDGKRKFASNSRLWCFDDSASILIGNGLGNVFGV